MEKQAVKRINRRCFNNRGTAVVEAAVGVTIFLFVSLVLFHFLHVAAVRTVVYEAAVEAAEYTAELAYLESTLTGGDDEEKKAGAAESFLGSASLLGAAEVKLLSSLDEPELVSRYILGGKAGIILLGSEFPDENGDIVLHVTYTVRIDTPLLPTLTWVFEDEICQKPYLGHNVSDGGDQDDDDEDPYVYVAENGTVYHTLRTCTHLLLKINLGTKKSAEASGYHACEFCGAGAGDYVLICPEGESYHTSANCRGLKRTVHRVRLSEVKGLPACSRCGK